MMKIVRGAVPIVLLFYLTLRHFLVSSKESSSVTQHQNPSVFQIFTISKPSYLVVAFTLNIIVVLLLVGTFNPFSYSQIPGFPTSKLSSFSCHDHDSNVHLAPPILNKGGSTLKDDNNDDEFVPRLVYVEYKEIDDDKYGEVSYEDSDNGSEEDELSKRIEDFIVANNKKWKDELLKERLLHERNFSTSAN